MVVVMGMEVEVRIGIRGEDVGDIVERVEWVENREGMRKKEGVDREF